MRFGARLLNVGLRAIVKPVLRRQTDPLRARCAFALAARVGFRRPPFTLHLKRADIDLVACGQTGGRGAVLYFHGGGYVVGSPETQLGLMAEIARRLQFPVHAPHYRQVPEHPAPAQFDDAVAAWDALMRRGYRPSDLILGGDSAGGGLALALLAHLCQAGTPPVAAFAFSPWTDLAGAGASMTANAASDAVFPAGRFAVLAAMVLQGLDPRDPRISPLYARFPNCPPVFIQYSGDEILADDSRRMTGPIPHATLDEWPGLPHVWTLFAGRLPQADAALDRLADFMREPLRPPGAGN